MYNKMAKTLVEFETLWSQAWVHSIDVACTVLFTLCIASASRPLAT